MKGVKLTPSHRIYGLGAILLVSLLICSRNFTRMGDRSFLVPLAVASIAYLLAISEFFSTPRFPRRVIVDEEIPLIKGSAELETAAAAL
jgi:hypothetical protein